MAKKRKHRSALKEKDGIVQPNHLSELGAEKLKVLRKSTPPVEDLIKGVLEGHKASLSRAITLIESKASKHQDQSRRLIESCLPKANNSVRIGITGVPGAGKSTFIEVFGKLLVDKGYKVAVLAIDPSSSISKGSILGDKTRMEELVKENNAFIRPSASGDTLGGVARKTREAIILCEAAGYDIIIIETVGVGQSETAVHSMTDFFLLLKIAGAGDELQGIKRGIVEMADAIVINKADGDNIKAARLAQIDFNNALHLYPSKESDWTPKALVCSAFNNQGISEIWNLISEYIDLTKDNGYFKDKRGKQNEYWLLQTIESTLKRQFFNDPIIKKELVHLLNELNDNKTSPFEAAQRLLDLKNN